MKIINRPKGTILLISVLIVTAILGVALNFGIIIISAIQRARLTGQALMAYYVAESGIEKGLFEIRTNQTLISSGSCDLPASIPSGFSCVREVVYPDSIDFSDISQDQSIQLTLVDVGGGTAANIESLKIKCSPASTPNPLQLELTLIPLFNYQPDPVARPTIKRMRSCSGLNTIIILNEPLATESYIFRIKALSGSAKDIAVTAYQRDDLAGAVVKIATTVKLTLTAKFKSASQKITAELPLNPKTAFGYFDYVLFSEENLDKDQPAPPPPPPANNNNNSNNNNGG